jgi:hypothetical protein
MRPIRLLAGLLSAALLGAPGLVLGADTASAAETLNTAITIEPIYGGNTMQYDASFSLSGSFQVVDSTGAEEDPRAGQTLTLQRLTEGSTTWTTLATYQDSWGAYYFPDLRAERNATYRVVFTGGTQPSSDYSSTDTLNPSSAGMAIKVARKLGDHGIKKGNRLYVAGKVSPSWANKVVYLQKKKCKSCAWRAYAKQRTTSRSGWKFRVYAPRHGTWYWRLYVAPSSGFIKSWSDHVFYTYSH